ncbi:MAG: hypothetical protein B6I31_00595, partial [Desulfobacteraceae bacterium 4572_19]
KILMHTPQDEVFLGVLHPDAALFEKPFSIKKAGKEHRKYIDRLRQQGVAVYTVVDVLLEGTVDEHGNTVTGPELDALRKFASKSLTIDSSSLPVDMQDKQIAYKQKIISHLAKGVVISKMHSEQRAPETEIIKFVLNKLGIKPIYEVTGKGRLEGGDYFSVGDTALIGQGLRTNAEGIKQLLDNKVFGLPRVVVVKDSWNNQEEMHLDTYFNIISPNLAVLVDLRMDMPGKPVTKDIQTTVDVYELEKGSYKLKLKDLNFQKYMEDELGFTLIPVSRKDQNLYGLNFLTIVQNKIFAIDGVSEEYKKVLSDAKVDATWMDFGALTSGYGAAHCTTQVLLREGTAIDTKSSQLTNTVFMVSPNDFAYNFETAKSNVFQHKLADSAKVTKLNNWFSTHRTGNGKNTLVLYPMLTPNRRAEIRTDLLKEKLKQQGYSIDKVVDLRHYVDEGKFLEGTGSMVLDRKNKVAFASLSPRTNIDVFYDFCKQLGYRPIIFHTYDQDGKLIYHTNVVMSIGDGFVVIAADNIRDSKEKTRVMAELRALGKKIIKISSDQVNNMCGNILELKSNNDGDIIVMSTTAYKHFTKDQKAELEKFGNIVPVDIHTIEEVGGGSARCMIAEIF